MKKNLTINNSEVKALYVTKAGTEATAYVTRSAAIYGEHKSDRKKREAARKAGKILVFNTRTRSWQALEIKAIMTEGATEWTPFEVKPRNYPKRFSLKQAVDFLASVGVRVELSKNEEGTCYLAFRENPAEDATEPFEFANGFELVKYAKSYA